MFQGTSELEDLMSPQTIQTILMAMMEHIVPTTEEDKKLVSSFEKQVCSSN